MFNQVGVSENHMILIVRSVQIMFYNFLKFRLRLRKE